MDIKDFQMQLIDFKVSLLWTSIFVNLRKSLETVEDKQKHFNMLEIFTGEIWPSEEDGNSFAICIWIHFFV